MAEHKVAEGAPADGVTNTAANRMAIETPDAHLEPVATYTLTTLRLKQDKWLKMMATPEFRVIVLDWLNNSQRRTLLMTLSPGGLLIPRNSLSDLCYNYAIQQQGAIGDSSTTNTTTMGDSARASAAEATNAPTGTTGHSISMAVSAMAASATVAATALLIPLPPPSSSFSTLDGVPRGKCVYFVRRSLAEDDAEPLTASNFHAQIVYGDLPVHSKIETLAILCDEIFQPLLVNPLNRKLWPAIVGKDLEARMKDVRNTLSEIKGKTNNRTVLSLLVSPTIIDEVATNVNQGKLAPANEAKFRNVLEEMFINWTAQIHEILQERSECVATTIGGLATRPQRNSAACNSRICAVTLPAHEITFWLHRKQNLLNIYEQLRSTAHQQLALILERIESVHAASFAQIFRQLIAAWQEAQDVALWLQPLLRQTSAFNALNFSNAGELVPPLVHVLHLIWCNARYYRSTQRMTTLLQCACNLLVHRASEDLEYPQLFRNDADEGLARISKTIEVLELFRNKLHEYKDKYGQALLPPLPGVEPPAPPLPTLHTGITETLQLWRFCADEVFGLSLQPFLWQLEEMRQIFEAAVSFQSLEKLEIGGLHGKYLTERLRQLHNEFKIVFEQWTNIEMDLTQQPQHTNWKRFKRQQADFFRQMAALEQKLATILVQAYEDCYDWEHLAKLTVMFGSILQRHNIPADLQVIVSHILSVYASELQQIELIVRSVLLAFECDGLTAIPAEWNFPPIAGAMLWLAQHVRRCDAFNAPELNELLHKLLAQSIAVDSDCSATATAAAQYEELNARRDVLTTQLSSLQLKIWHAWQQTIDERLARGFDAPVMLRSNSTSGGHVSTNAADSPAAIVGNSSMHIKLNDNTLANDDGDEIDSVDGEKTTLEMNFAPELFQLLKEAKYLLAQIQANIFNNAIAGSNYSAEADTEGVVGGAASTLVADAERRLPQALLDLYAQREALWQRKIKLIKIAEYYNGIRASVRSGDELQLMRHEISVVDSCVAAACERITWRHYDAALIEEIYEKTHSLHRRLQQTHAHLDGIFASIRRWSREPLHQRHQYGRNLLDPRHQRERVRARQQQCDETRALLNRLLIVNFCLFFNYEAENFEIYSRDLSVLEFLHEFPDEQRRKYNNYLASVDEVIRSEVRQAMKIRFS